MATEILWWIFAVAIVAVSAGVVISRSVIHSAIFLIGSLAGVGAMYLFLTVEFLALVQFLIYGGAVTVLEAADELKVLAHNHLPHGILATPALVDGTLYVRTTKQLFAFR